jgi:hypothetical protein
MSEPGPNVATIKNQRLSATIILSAFGIAGTLAAASVYLPDAAIRVEAIVTLVIGGLFGFIAGRKS